MSLELSGTKTPEWIMAAAAVATGVFVGWQSYLMRNSLDVSRLANVNVRKLDACVSFISNTAKYMPYVQALTGIDNDLTFLIVMNGNEQKRLESLEKAIDADISPIDYAGGELMFLNYPDFSNAEMSNLLSSFGVLQVLSQPEPRKLLIQAQEEILFLNSLARYAVGKGLSDSYLSNPINQKTVDSMRKSAIKIRDNIHSISDQCVSLIQGDDEVKL